MAEYIGPNGKTNGPIQLGNSGAWLSSSLLGIGEFQQQIKHFNISYDKERTKLMVGRAKTPELGTYKDENGNSQPNCDPYSLATVEWVMAYAALPPGEKSLDLSIYLTKNEFLNWKSMIESGTDSTNATVNALQNQLNELDKAVGELKEQVGKMPDFLYINCGGAQPQFEIVKG